MKHERPGEALPDGAPSLPVWWRTASVTGMLCISTASCLLHCGICPNAWNCVSLCSRIHGVLSKVVNACCGVRTSCLESQWLSLVRGPKGLPSGFRRFPILAG